MRIPEQSARRRKLFALAKQLDLSTEERMEIAQTLLWRDVTSWSQLDDRQVDRLLDALEGYVLVAHTYSVR